MEQDNSVPAESGKRLAERVTERSAAYPSVTIEYILGFVAELKQQFQKTQFKREDVTSVLNRGSTAINRDISAAVQYGLVDKTVGTGYKLTQLTEHILQPYNQEEKLDNIAECFKNPKLYNVLIERFKGEVLPTDEVLKVILIREHDITSNAAPQAVDVFIQNATYAGLLNSQRVLMSSTSQELLIIPDEKKEDYGEAYKNDAPNTRNTAENVPVMGRDVDEKPQFQPQKLLNDTSDKLEVIIHLSEKKTAQLIYPSSIKARDIQILKMQIDLLELTLDT